MEAKQAEIEKELRKKANVERELKTVKMDLEGKRQEVEEKQAASQKAQEDVCVRVVDYHH